MYAIHRPNRRYRQLAKVIGYILHDRRLTSLAIPVAMNAELKELQAARYAANTYSNKPDPEWIGASSEVTHD
jgi:hypothetical protein